MGVWIAAVVLLVLAILPLGVHVRYNDAGFLLRVIAGPVKITVFPRKKKPKKQLVQSSANRQKYKRNWMNRKRKLKKSRPITKML